jgi:tetratricopeptide (TPR) repeat protein
MGPDRAEQLLGMGRAAEAKAAYEEHLLQHTDDIDARLGHGLALLATGDAASSVQELTWVLERAPGQTHARYNRAIANAALRQDAEALADLDLLIAENPQAWYLRSDRGGLLLRGGQIEDATGELRKAVELAPEEPAPWLNLGLALHAAGKLVEAHEYLTRAARERVPGAFTALQRVRQAYYYQAETNEVGETVTRVLEAKSAAEAAELAYARPYLLAESLLDHVEQTVRAHPDQAPPDAQARLADLRLLAAGEESSGGQRTAQEADYRRLAEQQILLYQRGDKEEAARMAPDLVEMARSIFGPDSSEYGQQLANRAVFEDRDALFGEALDVLTRAAPELIPGVTANYANLKADPDAMALLRSALPYLSVDVPQDAAARVYTGLSTRLLRLGQAHEAEGTIREALDSRPFTGAPLASLVIALSEALFNQEDYTESAELCEQALNLYREVYGDTHKKVADTLRGLGRIHAKSGHTGQAERWLLRAADTWRRLDIPMELALTQGDLAKLYADTGAETVARQAAEQALRTLDPLPGLADPNEPEVLDRIRDAYRGLHDLDEELTIQLRLVDLVPDSAQQLNNLADIYYRSSRYDEAAHWYAESLSRATPDTIFLARHNLANALDSLGRTDEAVTQHEQALAEMRAALPAGHPHLVHSLIDLAGMLADIGQRNKAAELIAEARPYLHGDAVLQAKAAALAQQLNLDAQELGSAAEQYRRLVDGTKQARTRGAYPEAERMLGQAIEIAVAEYGPRHIEVARLKLVLAAVRRDAGTIQGVEELIREALSIQEESLAADDKMLVTARLELGNLLAEDARDEEASELLASAMEHTEGAQLGRALTSLGLIAQRRGDFGRAEQHFRRALELADEPVNRLISRRNLVTLLIDERRLTEAGELAQETLELAGEWFGKSDPRIGEALLTYTKTIREQGRFGECEQLARTALSLLENAYPGDHRDVADAANELGLALSGQGKMAEAEQWFERVSESVRGNPRREAPALMNQATVYEEVGDFGRATSLVTKAVGLLETSSGRQGPQYGKALARLGKLERIQGKTTAVTTLTKAYRIIEGSAAEHPSLVEPLLELAMLYLDIGARDTAVAFAERALAIARAAYGADNPALAPYLALLARSKAYTGELDAAESLYQASLTCHPEATETLRTFASFQAARGDRKAALRLLDQLVHREDEILRELASTSTSEHRRRTFFTRLWATVDAYLTLTSLDDARHAWELVVRRLGQDADYLRSERAAALRGSGTQTLQELGILRAHLARAVIADDTAKAEQLRERRDELERLLAGYLITGVEAPDADLISASLPAGTTLVTYILNEMVDFGHAALGTAPAARDGIHVRRPKRYVAFVITADESRMLDLGAAEPIEANLARLRELLVPSIRPDQALERDLAADALRGQLIDPLALRDQNLLIVAGGRLGLLPFQLLPLKKTGRLIDERTIFYLSAPRDLLRWAKPPRYHTPGPALVIADPDYDLGSQTRGTPMAPLPSTAEEGAQVASLLGTGALTGADAVKISMTAAHSPIVVHLATHGIFLPSPEPPPPSDYYEIMYTVEVPGEGVFVAGAEQGTQPDLTPAGLPRSDADPLLRSALALAGINTWLNGSDPPPEADIGILTADEVCTLDLRDTQLVVLSACETGLGDGREDEGLIGLRWAFAVAGARALVTSLWQVLDQATTELMTEFYAQLTTGAKIPDAIRAAQQSARRHHPDPYHWAAFVAHGDPAATISQFRPIPR